jgi:hypothetical protein
MGHPSETIVQRPSTSLTRRILRGDTNASNTAGMQTIAYEDGYCGRYNVDERMGFMSPQPRSRLPVPWDLWEDVLDDARQANLQVGDKIGLTQVEAAASSAWRNTVHQVRTESLPRR